jgi:branched-chain amino acid transport system permease protein
VDGAFGLWARATPERAHLVEGIEHADSWATDAHKWLNVPYDSGVAFVRDGRPRDERAGALLGEREHVDQPAERDLLERGRSGGHVEETRVLIPRSREPARRERGGKRPSDDEPEEARTGHRHRRGRDDLIQLCENLLRIERRVLQGSVERAERGDGLPFPLVLLCTGLLTMVLGTLVGLPALRLSGLYLALITLMLAGAITVALRTMQFPNGGPGFLGNDPSSSEAVRRPSIATSDPAFFRYTVVVCVIMFALALWHVRGKAGHAWAAIRQSEPAALAAGVNITLYKLWAFALASFMTGVAGGLLAADVSRLYAISFPTSNSIILLAVVLMGGIYSLWGAIVAGVFYSLLPALLNDWGLPADLLTILFGVGVIQVLLTAPGGLAQQFPRDMKRLGGRIASLFKRGAPAGGRPT